MVLDSPRNPVFEVVTGRNHDRSSSGISLGFCGYYLVDHERSLEFNSPVRVNKPLRIHTMIEQTNNKTSVEMNKNK